MQNINIDSMSDADLENVKIQLENESNRRMRIAWFPGQLRQMVLDARAGGEIPDATIRGIFEDAMNANID